MEIHELVKKIEGGMPPPFQDYRAMVTPSEVPLEFHPFVFIAMMATIVGKRAYVVAGTDKVYPNLWTLLIGESSVSRKSTAARPAQKLLDKVNPKLLLPDPGSLEGLYAAIRDAGGVGLQFHTELGALLGSLEKSYMGSMTESYCGLYDPQGAKLSRSFSQHKVELDTTAVSWLACTTQVGLNMHITADDNRITVGFLPRFNIVLGRTVAGFIPFRRPIEDEKQQILIKKLKLIDTKLGGNETMYTYNQGAVKMFSDWYMGHRRQVDEGIVTPTVGYFWVRTLEVVKKYALIFTVLSQKDVIDVESMAQAILVGEYFLYTSRQLIEKEIAPDRNEREMQKIMRCIERKSEHKRSKWVARRDILKDTHMIINTFDPFIKTLMERGDVEEQPTDKGAKNYKLVINKEGVVNR